jgi:hypothetical protein
MSDALRSKLEQRVNRRSFLRGSTLAAAGLAGVAAWPGFAAAQDQQPPQRDGEGKKADGGKADDRSRPDREANNDLPADEQDPSKITHKDDRGRDYRICPQCGYNMYRQDRTWTCENCGYSYSE